MLKRSVIVAGVLAIGFVLGFGTLAFTQDKKPAVPATRAGLYRIHAAAKSLEDAERHLQRSEHHFGGHNYEPGHTEGDPNPGDDLRQTGAQDDLPKKLAGAEAEVLRRAQINELHVLDGGDCRDRDRKNTGQKDQEDRRGIAHPEPENRDRNPGDR